MPALITIEDHLTLEQLSEVSKLFTYHQLDKGPAWGSFLSLRFPGGKTTMRCLRFPAGVQVIRREPLPAVILTLQVTRGQTFRFNGVTFKSSRPMLMQVHHPDGLNMVLPEGMEGCSLVFDPETFNEQCRVLFQREPPAKGNQLGYPIEAAAYRGLLTYSRLIEMLARCQGSPDIFDNDCSCRAMEKEITYRVIKAIYTGEDKGCDLRPGYHLKLVNGVIDYMMANLDQPLHTVDFCRVGRTPLRTLHLAFHKVVGLAPMRYFRILRLNEAFRRLCRQEGSVTEVATNLGFWHLGQFSQDFKNLFGIKPNQVKRLTRIAWKNCANMVKNNNMI